MTTKLELQIINYLATQPGTTLELPGKDPFTDYSISERGVWDLFERLGYSRLQIVRAIDNLIARGTLLSHNGRLILCWALRFEKAARELI